MSKTVSFEQLVEEINMLRKKQVLLLIGIDGCGGSGKSTLAGRLAENFKNCTIVHHDDFYLPSDQIITGNSAEKPIGADFDWQRFTKQVLLPLSQGKAGYYQRYDWDTDQLAEWHTVPAEGMVIIEGVYSTRQEIADLYDLKIWVETPRSARLARGLERDGEEARSMWEDNWMIAEDLYVKKQKPSERSDYILDGTK